VDGSTASPGYDVAPEHLTHSISQYCSVSLCSRTVQSNSHHMLNREPASIYNAELQLD
jgi:hypothetical protein